MKEDRWIINEIKKRNEMGIHEIIDKYGGLLMSVIGRHSYGYTNYQEECFNDVLLAVWNNIDKFDEDKGEFKNWIGAIARFKALNIVRKYKKEMQNQELTEDILSETNFDIIIKDDIEDLLSCLSPTDREILLKLFYEGLTVSEVANLYDISETSIYKKISRGRKKMQKKRSEEDGR